MPIEEREKGQIVLSVDVIEEALARGKPTKVDHLNGLVVRRGESLHVPTPARAAIDRIIDPSQFRQWVDLAFGRPYIQSPHHEQGHMQSGMLATLRLTVAIGALAAVAGGCVNLADLKGGGAPMITGDALTSREANMQAVWVGRSYQELVGTWGAPRMLLHIPGGHRPDEMVVVYGVRNSAVGCVDAFTVYNGSTRQPNAKSEVVNYFCR